METVKSLKSEFDLDLLTPKSIAVTPPVMVNTSVNCRLCMSKRKGVIVQKPLPKTDGQPAMVKPVYPHNFIGRGGGHNNFVGGRGGIIKLLLFFFLFFFLLTLVKGHYKRL